MKNPKTFQRRQFLRGVGSVALGLPALVQLNTEMVAADASVDAVCPAGRRPGDVDPVCTYALARTHCAPDGSAYLRCPLTPADRKAILSAR